MRQNKVTNCLKLRMYEFKTSTKKDNLKVYEIIALKTFQYLTENYNESVVGVWCEKFVLRCTTNYRNIGSSSLWWMVRIDFQPAVGFLELEPVLVLIGPHDTERFTSLMDLLKHNLFGLSGCM